MVVHVRWIPQSLGLQPGRAAERILLANSIILPMLPWASLPQAGENATPGRGKGRAAERSEGSVCDGLWQNEFVAPEEIDVTPDHGGQSSDVGGMSCHASISKLAQRFLHVDRVPMDDDVEGQAESAKLFLLSLAEWASDFTTLAMMDPAAKLVPQLLAVQLCQDSSAEWLVVNVIPTALARDSSVTSGCYTNGPRR